MKKLLDAIMLTFAINFLLLAVGATWLMKSGRIDKDELAQMREMVFPTTAPATQPTDEDQAATQPTLKLEALLARQAGRPASEQVQFIQRTFDAQMALLDRRQRELNDLQRQVELAKQQMARDRAVLEADQKKLADRETEVTRLAEDKGFQDTLELYRTMPAKQAKDVMLSLDDATVVRYLQAMEPKQATKIIKEFKTPQETERIQKILETMRSQTASVAGKE